MIFLDMRDFKIMSITNLRALIMWDTAFRALHFITIF